MVSRPRRYDLLARLFDYPEEGGYPEAVERAVAALEDGYTEAVASLRELLAALDGASPERIQEEYTRTFDINPVCTLEIGWHIYGEDYARGALLVKLREQLRRVNVPESAELPDHLTHVLAVLGRLDGAEADELAGRYVLPGLDKMLEGTAAGDHPYRALVESIRHVVRSDHDVEAVPPRAPREDPPDWKNRMPVFGNRGCGERRCDR